MRGQMNSPNFALSGYSAEAQRDRMPGNSFAGSCNPGRFAGCT
jgi:hypothetical protein